MLRLRLTRLRVRLRLLLLPRRRLRPLTTSATSWQTSADCKESNNNLLGVSTTIMHKHHDFNSYPLLPTRLLHSDGHLIKRPAGQPQCWMLMHYWKKDTRKAAEERRDGWTSGLDRLFARSFVRSFARLLARSALGRLTICYAERTRSAGGSEWVREESLAAALRRPEEEPCGSMEAMKDGRTRTDGRTDGHTARQSITSPDETI